MLTMTMMAMSMIVIIFMMMMQADDDCYPHPHYCLLVPVLEVVLQDAPLAGLLARVRVGAGHWQLVQQPFQHQVAENDNTVNIWRTRKLNLGVQVISLRGLRQMGQVAFTRK